jgi:hypothetical protein
LKNEQATGLIQSLVFEGSDEYMYIDYIAINPNWIPGGNSGPAFTNQNTKIRRFKISPSAQIKI